jgi:hypothetical protein
MKVIDQNNQLIQNPSALPLVAKTAERPLTPGQVPIDTQHMPGLDERVRRTVATTHGLGGVPEMQAIAETQNDVIRESVRVATIPVEIGTDEVSDADDKHLCPRDRMVARLRNIRDRLVAYADQSKGRAALVLSLLSTSQELDRAIEYGANLPPDWKPARTAATSTIAVGDHVFIRSRHRALYQSDLSADDMDDMAVLRIGEKRLRCHCVASGASIFVPAGHVEKK